MERNQTTELKQNQTTEFFNQYKNILVTGGCGFIGSNFLNYMMVKHTDISFHNIDKLDYCADKKNVNDSTNYFFYKCDINDKNFVLHILESNEIDMIVHFAAQSHVDNSFDNSMQFTIDNVMGTHTLLECSRLYGKLKKFIHISTDEVYGEIDDSDEECHEKSILNPTNPYSASKAAAEMFVNSYFNSYKLPVITVRMNNVYGPNQYPEKLIPKFKQLLLNNQKMTIHGNGETKRNFIHVEDAVCAIELIIINGIVGNVYNIGTSNEYSVLDIAKMLLEKYKPTENFDDWVEFVNDRPFNDYRYSINSDKLTSLGWIPRKNLDI